ncbi:MAG: hypothetical protein SGJ19_14135 [Planctomycetia bacterium]|nr:hypothetical protein [Planctomycetia bacterium]
MNAKQPDTEIELLGYLLDALESDEREALESRLASDPQLQRSVQVLRRALTPLRSDAEHSAPPLGLAERCCQFIERQANAPAVQVEYGEQRTTWRWLDLAVAASVLFVASMLFFPSVMKSRFDQQVAYCSENLRQVSNGLWQYSQQHGGYFPYVPTEGNYAAAGIFGPTLTDGRYLENSRSLLCPSSPQAAADQAPVTMASIGKAEGAPLLELQRSMGGSYGYALGYEKDGRYLGNKNQGRARFALVADSSSPQDSGDVSANHEGRGQNVLYEDGHVQFQRTCTAAGCKDDIYHNDLGIIGAGQHVNDAVVAPSWARPVQKIHLFRIYLRVPVNTKVRVPHRNADSSNSLPQLMEMNELAK